MTMMMMMMMNDDDNENDYSESDDDGESDDSLSESAALSLVDDDEDDDEEEEDAELLVAPAQVSKYHFIFCSWSFFLPIFLYVLPVIVTTICKQPASTCCQPYLYQGY